MLEGAWRINGAFHVVCREAFQGRGLQRVACAADDAGEPINQLTEPRAGSMSTCKGLGLMNQTRPDKPPPPEHCGYSHETVVSLLSLKPSKTTAL